MAEIVNLRRARKHRAREAASQDAAANRARFGRTRAERDRDALESAQAARTLDGARLDQANCAKDRDTTS